MLYEATPFLIEKSEHISVKNSLKLSANAEKILKERYLARNEKGKTVETPQEMFKRVAKTIAEVDKKYEKTKNSGKTEEIVKQVVNELNIKAEISKIEDLQKIIDKGIMMTPAVAIDGEIKILGRVPSTQDVKKIIQ